MGLQEFPSKPVNKGGVILGTVNGPSEVAIGAQDSYLVADSTQTPGAKWQTYRKYNTVQLTSGTSWTVPATVEMIDVFLIGGGQGGQGCSGTAAANNANSGSGGHGGAMMFVKDYSVTPGGTITYAIGSGGAGAANPAPTASQNPYGGNGGNTTFGVLVAPGANARYGSSNTYASSNTYRGVYDFNSPDNGGGGAVALTSSNDWTLSQQPHMNHNVWIHGHYALSASGATPFTWPNSNWRTTYSNTSKYSGINKDFHKIVAAFTAPSGSAPSVNELTQNTKQDGWGGRAGSGVTTSSPYYAETSWHGAGQAGTINTTTTGTARSGNGGAAGTNSGAGGGGSASVSGASAVVAGAAGGAGGSGVIFIGYWA
jgi:hypothetical protein